MVLKILPITPCFGEHFACLTFSTMFIFNISLIVIVILCCVKNVCDYANYSRDPERRDRAVVVVNHHRELTDFQHLTKEELSKM